MQYLRKIEEATKVFGFQAVAVPGDGNCLFHAFGELLGLKHVELRR